MFPARSPRGTGGESRDQAVDFSAASNFLTGLKIDAELCLEPCRSEEWLATIQNLFHALMSIEQEGRATVRSPTAWSHDSMFGHELGQLIRIAGEVPVAALEAISAQKKIRLLAVLLDALVLACCEIAGPAVQRPSAA